MDKEQFEKLENHLEKILAVQMAGHRVACGLLNVISARLASEKHRNDLHNKAINEGAAMFDKECVDALNGLRCRIQKTTE